MQGAFESPSVVPLLRKEKRMESYKDSETTKPKAEMRTRTGILGLRKGFFQEWKRQSVPERK